MWRWTTLALHILRATLCPTMTLTKLIAATAKGELDLKASPRKRVRQQQALRQLLQAWILAQPGLG